MHNFISSGFKLGILGGGQLGKMLILSTASFDVFTKVLDPDPACSCAPICNELVTGSFQDYQTVFDFGKDCDVITVEIEHVNTEALKDLQKAGIEVHPDPAVLETIKDKGLQKEFYRLHQLPTADFFLVENEEETRLALKEGRISFPFVQKTRTAGYDGKGVKVVRDETGLGDMLPGPSVIEQAVEIHRELAVIVATSAFNPEPVAFDVVEMEFNEEANLVEFLSCPAAVSEEIRKEATELAAKTLKVYGIRGVLAVELFLDKNGRLLINEVAPRPHNSGHHTIDSCVTSQFEQHFRSVLNLPLGSTESLSPAVMGNILGAPGYSGPVKYQGLEESMKVAGTKFHIYGKKSTRPFRKMGHFTVLAPDVSSALEKARLINSTLKVIS